MVKDTIIVESRLKFYLSLTTRKAQIKVKSTLHILTAGDWDCVAAVERLPALHYSEDFIFLPFGIMGFIVEL